ncbi:hypothetical protein ACIA6D_41830 [Streptomyces cacaoi]|uniref:hypothetical protein n=1 Tax=Streptomyces TaxID=1883 RepID=UPI003654B4FD
MKKALAGMFAVLALAGSGLAASADSASAAQVKTITCTKQFQDANTVGFRCTGGGPFYTQALCKNGKWAHGADAAAGTTSYAYCTSLNSSLAVPLQAYGRGAA